MTDITQNADTYPPAIYQISVTDPVLGGAGGIANKAAAALADRTAYQRMRNVTPWVPGLDQPYPAHAYVQRSGLTYKSLAANANIDPATPAAVGIWERWAYTESEMYAFLKNNHGGNCPVTGPAAAPSAAAPWTMYTSVAPYFEVWMWTGAVTGWRVAANRYGLEYNSNVYALTASVTRVVQTFVAPRDGILTCSLSNFCVAPAAGNTLFVQCFYNAQTICADSTVADLIGRQQYVSAAQSMPVLAGAVLTCEIFSQQAVAAQVRSSIRYLN